MNGEIFRPIERMAGYFVSSLGRIWSGKSERFLKTCSSWGYEVIVINHKHKHTARLIHKVVAETFLGLRPSTHHVVNHRDGNKRNNNVNNLEWITKSQDVHHAILTGLYKPIHGERHHRAKLTDEDIKEIRSLRSNHKLKEIAAMFGISRSYVGQVCQGEYRTER